MAAHTITCAGDWCEEFSVRASYGPVDREQLASDHREQLASEGWTDVEGRDYCPEHKEG